MFLINWTSLTTSNIKKTLPQTSREPVGKELFIHIILTVLKFRNHQSIWNLLMLNITRVYCSLNKMFWVYLCESLECITRIKQIIQPGTIVHITDI